VAVAVGLVVLIAPEVVSARLQQSFFGVNPQVPLSKPDFARMRGTIGSVRLSAVWPQLEPRQGHWDFGELDRLIGESAQQDIRVLLELYGTPPWINPVSADPPSSRAETLAWLGFVRRVVHRYGPDGSFWHGRRRRLPVHSWQIWNEPNFLLFWQPRPEPRHYAELLRLTAHAIRTVDPRARIIAAGVAPVEGGIPPARFLREMYSVRGVKDSFDVAALHPYASSVRGVEYEIQQIRQVMAAAGDSHSPLRLTEIGVASAADSPTAFNKGWRGQARYLSRTFEMLIANRRRWRIAGVDWFSWRDGPPDPHCVFCEFSGLVRANGRPKPALRALRRLVRQAQLGA